MEKKKKALIFLLFLLLPFINGDIGRVVINQDVDTHANTTGLFIYNDTYTVYFNGSYLNETGDNRWLMLNGSNADSNIDIGDYNFSMGDNLSIGDGSLFYETGGSTFKLSNGLYIQGPNGFLDVATKGLFGEYVTIGEYLEVDEYVTIADYLNISNGLNVWGNSTFNGSLNPMTSLTFDIGSGVQRWRNLFVTNISADFIEASENITTLQYFVGSGAYLTNLNVSGNITGSLEASDILNEYWVNSSGDSMTGNLNVTGNQIIDVGRIMMNADSEIYFGSASSRIYSTATNNLFLDSDDVLELSSNNEIYMRPDNDVNDFFIFGTDTDRPFIESYLSNLELRPGDGLVVVTGNISADYGFFNYLNSTNITSTGWCNTTDCYSVADFLLNTGGDFSMADFQSSFDANLSDVTEIYTDTINVTNLNVTGDIYLENDSVITRSDSNKEIGISGNGGPIVFNLA